MNESNVIGGAGASTGATLHVTTAMTEQEIRDSLNRPVFLSVLPVLGFLRLPKEYLFTEIARLDSLLERYPSLVASAEDYTIMTSLQYCEGICKIRYNELRKLVTEWEDKAGKSGVLAVPR
jgi:hypothetical protein